MEPDEPGLELFVLVGAARAHDNVSVRLEDLAEYVAAVVEKGESVRLGFYDGGYPGSAEFWPRRLVHGDSLRSMKIFTGSVGVDAQFPGCLIISRGQNKPEAVLMFTSNVGTSDYDDDD